MDEMLAAAILQWRDLAATYRRDGNTVMANTCERTAQAFEIQRDTGIAVCVCCFKPFGQGLRL